MKLRDRVAVVTGAAKGMGGAICTALAREGARLVLAAREAGPLQDLARRLPAAGDGAGGHLAVPTDVADARAVDALARRAFEACGRVDILINAAGVIGPIETPLHKIAPEDWDRVLGVNLRGVFLCCRAVVPSMIERRQGKIVNIAGTSGLRGYRNRAAYSSSKWAVRGLTRTLALELGPYGINVNAVCPGVVQGDRMTTIIREKARVRGWTDAQVYEEYTREMALGRFTTEEDIAHAVLFLVSEESRQITGHEIVVDGGWDV
jgi:NAD(P)-dependent dehydrogenase (short-subunit alcohol dehydrogenase family)